MNTLHQGETLPPWPDTEMMPKFPSLRENIEVDVCIVGGGIGGITSAYLLLKEGKSVCLLEDFELASGQTGRTTAHLTAVLDERYFEIEKNRGQKNARLAAVSHMAALDKIEEIIQKENINCEMDRVDGYLFINEEGNTRELRRELEAARRCGLDVQLLENFPVDSFDIGPCLRFPNQMQIHPLRYLSYLSKSIVKGGGRIFTHTHVAEIKGGENAYVRTQNGSEVKCKSVIVATNTPINDRVAIHTKQAPYRTYVLGFRVPKGRIPKALYWDMDDPYHYIRIEPGVSDIYDILIVGGEDHKTGQDEHPEQRFNRLEDWARARFPMATEIVYSWSGQIMESMDGLAYMGHNPMDFDNVYIITGHCGNGITSCTIGAMLINDLIMGRECLWESLYNPSRVPLRSSGFFIKENSNVITQYGDWFATRTKPDLNLLQKEEGTVFREGLKMIAAYKDDDGNIEYMSASCPHLAGVVHWNPVEKSWDCPCHGSRFDCHGKVVEGPAFRDLKKIDHKEESEPISVSP